MDRTRRAICSAILQGAELGIAREHVQDMASQKPVRLVVRRMDFLIEDERLTEFFQPTENPRLSKSLDTINGSRAVSSVNLGARGTVASENSSTGGESARCVIGGESARCV